MKKKIPSLLLATSLAVASNAYAGFMPYGVHNDVTINNVTNNWGWSECYSTTYGSAGDGDSVAGILNQCAGDNLMLAARRVGSSTFDVLAAASFADVTFDTGSERHTTNTANGAEWYFSDAWSWGFAGLGDTVNRTSCDTNGGGERDRLCWHTRDGNMLYGYRSGNNFLNNNDSWEKVILSMNNSPRPVSEPSSLLLLGLGILGLTGLRRLTAAK